jgi:DHA1 family bicyclomycin/chloramphenicol resistance-like MFS transporter
MPRPPSLTTLILLTMATTLSLNMFLPALPVMAREFGVSYGVISLSFGGYLGVTAVMALILGSLSDRVGRRPVALGVAAVFTLASMGAAMAQDVTWFLACRFAQGVMVGGFVLASAVVRDTRAGHEVASLLAYITSAMAVAPLLGPLLGGVVTSALDGERCSGSMQDWAGFCWPCWQSI